jgi:putative hydrolase of the HAD superfamily
VKGVLVDLGGVLIADHWPGAADHWGARLGIRTDRFMAAVFDGNDDQVLVGVMTELAWWERVRERSRAA